MKAETPGTTIAFLNNYFPLKELPDDVIAVPLSAKSMHDVKIGHRDYLKLEEYVDYTFGHQKKEAIWKCFQNLFDRGDQLVGEYYNDTRISRYGPFNLFARTLRWAFETQIIYYRIADRIVEEFRPQRIVYSFKDIYRFDDIVPSRFAGTFLKEVFEKIANKRGVIFECLDGNTSSPSSGGSVRRSLFNGIKAQIQQHLQESKDTLKLLWSKLQLQKERISRNALFLQTGWGVFQYMSYFRKVKLFRSDTLFTHITVKASASVIDADKFRHEVKSMSALFGFDIEFILRNVIDVFRVSVPLVIGRAYAFHNYLVENNITYAFYTNLSHDLLPFQMAIKWDRSIVGVCKCHGDGAYDATVWRNTELQAVSLYLTEFEELNDYYIKENGIFPKTAVCIHDAVNLNSMKKRHGNFRTGKLVFVPWMLEPIFSFDVAEIPPPFLFRVQLEIIRVLSGLKDFEVVLKCLPKASTGDLHYPIPEIVAAEYPNIRISYLPLRKELLDAEFCLLDAPSSSMWDAINQRVPCHSLVWSKSHIRDTARAYYSRFLTFFDSDTDVGMKVAEIMKDRRFAVVEEEEARRMKMDRSQIVRVLKSFGDSSNHPEMTALASGSSDS